MRSWFLALHRYGGLILAALLILSGLTGSVLVFRDALDSRLRPEVHTVTAGGQHLPWQHLLEEVAKAVPQHAPSAAFLPTAANRPIEFRFRHDPLLRVYLDPYSGAILAQESATGTFTGFLWELHAHLLSGKVGGKIIGWAGIGLAILVLAGLWLWWPRTGRWKAALRIKRGAAPVRFWLDLHRVSGVFTSVLLLLSALTGASLALPDLTRTVLQATTGYDMRQPAPKVALPAKQPVPLEKLLEVAQQQFPHGRITRLSFPVKPEDALGVRMRLPGEIHQFGRSFVWVDPGQGTVLRADNALSGNTALQIHAWLFPLHTGVWAGLPTQILQLLAGLSLPLFSLTGIWLWWKGRQARRRDRQRSR